MLLKSDGDVAIAGDVDAALREVAIATPDVVLLDLVMPGRSGLELLEELRERGVRAPVIVLTATNTVSAAVQAMKHGAAETVFVAVKTMTGARTPRFASSSSRSSPLRPGITRSRIASSSAAWWAGAPPCATSSGRSNGSRGPRRRCS